MDPALYKAAVLGNVSSLRHLVDNDPKILSSTTPQLNTVLHLAALNGHAEFAHVVLEKNEELLVARNADGSIPLHLVAKSGNLEVALELIRHAVAWPQNLKSPLIMTDEAGNSPLHEAVRHRRATVALALLDVYPSQGYDLNKKMESPLHMAAREGLVHVVRKIVDFPWVEAQYVPSVSASGTVLHQAVLGGHTRIVEILLEKRHYLIDLTDSDGNNALHYAARKNHSHAVELLLNNKPELAYNRNNEWQSPLHVAAHFGSTEVIKALLRHCPDVAAMVDNFGRNALHVSVTRGKTNALRCLLRHVHRADVLNRVDNNGNTPLHLATEMNLVQSALLLLKDRHVNLYVRNRAGHTARGLLEIRSANAEMDDHVMYLRDRLKYEESIRWHSAFSPSCRATSEKSFERILETYILVATLIATVTFAATFTMPGGYDQIKGIALQGHNTAFKIFVISNTVATCSSIVVVFSFIWAWQDRLKFKFDRLLWGHWLTVLACLAMLVSLMTAVYITVAPTSLWSAYVVIAIGASTPAVVFLMLGRDVMHVPQ